MPRYFLIVDHSESSAVAAHVLRAAGQRVDASNSTKTACERIAMLDESRDDLVVIVDADLLDGALELSRALASRQNTVVILAINDVFNDPRAAGQRFVVSKPYDDSLLGPVDEAVGHLTMCRLLRHVVSILMVQPDSPGDWNAAGSGCLVQLPARAVILTASHVVEWMQHEGMKTYIGGNGTPVDISSWPVLGIDKVVDIATIGIPEAFDRDLRGKWIHRCRRMPPSLTGPS